MIHLLQANDVRIVSDDLLNLFPLPQVPVQSLCAAVDKLVDAGAKTLGQDIPLQNTDLGLGG